MSLLNETLWPVQRQAVEQIQSHPLRLLADQPGSGKTLMAIASLESRGLFSTSNAVSLILAPKTPCSITWIPHIQRFVGDDVEVIDAFSGSGTARNARLGTDTLGDQPRLIVGNHDAIRVGKAPFLPNLFKLPLDAIVIDEAHLVLPTQTDNYRDMTQFWRGLTKLQIKPGAMRLPMTGTPDRSKLWYRYGTLKFLFPAAHTNYNLWLADNFHLDHRQLSLTVAGGRRVNRTIIDVKGVKSPERWMAMDSIYVIRRTKDEIQAGRSKKQHIPIVLDMEPKQKRQYREFERAFREDEEQNAAVYTLRSRQIATVERDLESWMPESDAASNKLEWLMQWLTERGHFDPEYVSDPENPSKVVIASFLNGNLEWLKAELNGRGIWAEIMKGGQPAMNQVTQREFQDSSSKLRVILLQQNLGVGIDLDMADDLIFLDVPYNSDDAEQIEDRIDRLSRNHRVTIWWLLSSGTVDIAIAEENQARFESTRELLDGARGIDYARQMLGKIRKG